MDISYINVCGTFYFLFRVLDGCSRYIISWDIKDAMKESDVEIVLHRAKEKYPEARPRIISDNGSQFIAKDFADAKLSESGKAEAGSAGEQPAEE